jgi:N-acetylglucosaminyldiphosphoundecaprenol N-acetyl-beta-D-mannosaminyltransferase
MIARDAGVLLGVPIDRKSLEAATAETLAAIEQRSPQVIFACANPHSLVTAERDPAFKLALNNASLVVADGVGVTMMARLAGVKVGPRITGSDYFRSIMEALAKRGTGRVFFFGSSPTALSRIADRMQRELPGVQLCGTLSPPFRWWSAEEDTAMVATINEADPDVLWVGMTAPKQEKWVEQNRHRIRAPVIASIGAVFDFYAGLNLRAPRWMCGLGIEWLYRLAREPRRMWRRSFVSAPKFVALVTWRHVLGIPATRDSSAN